MQQEVEGREGHPLSNGTQIPLHFPYHHAHGLPTWKIIMLRLKKVIFCGRCSVFRVIKSQDPVWLMEP